MTAVEKPMETVARHRYARLSPQKCRLVADLIRGKSVDEALRVLRFCEKDAARIVRNVLESAVANAEHNRGADVDVLRVVRVTVDEGPRLRRFHARARGRSNVIIKRTCHVTVAVDAR